MCSLRCVFVLLLLKTHIFSSPRLFWRSQPAAHQRTHSTSLCQLKLLEMNVPLPLSAQLRQRLQQLLILEHPQQSHLRLLQQRRPLRTRIHSCRYFISLPTTQIMNCYSIQQHTLVLTHATNACSLAPVGCTTAARVSMMCIQSAQSIHLPLDSEPLDLSRIVCTAKFFFFLRQQSSRPLILFSLAQLAGGLVNKALGGLARSSLPAEALGANAALYGPHNAFDQNSDSMWVSVVVSNPTQPYTFPHHLTYYLPDRQCILEYALTGHAYDAQSVQNPSAWTLSASNDNHTWVVLDRQQQQRLSPRTLNVYPIPNAERLGTFAAYRLSFLANSGWNTTPCVAVGQVELRARP